MRRSYSTYFGGEEHEAAQDVVVVGGANGTIWFTGCTLSSGSAGFPTRVNAYDDSHNGVDDVFIAQLDPTQSPANQLLYCTYYGGDTTDQAHAIHVTGDHVLIAGWTNSDNDTNIFKHVYMSKDQPEGADGLLLHLDTSQSGSNQLKWALPFGGGSGEGGASPTDRFYDMIVHDIDEVTLVGITTCDDYPEKLQTQTNQTGTDAVVTRLIHDSANQETELVFSTYLGGNGVDEAFAVALGSNDVFAVAGFTTSTSSFPTTNAYDSTHNGAEDAFVTEFYYQTSPSTSLGIIGSTYLGGSSFDQIGGIITTKFNNDTYFSHGLAMDGTTVYLTGFTYSSGFPVVSAFQSTIGGDRDAFVARMTLLPAPDQ